MVSLGWAVVVCYMLDSFPHYAIYGGTNGQHVFLRDPAFPKRYVTQAHKFLKWWKVDKKGFPKSYRWYAAFRK